MRALLDTDVVMDLFLDREPFAEAAAGLWHAHEQGRFEAHVSALTPVNLFYVGRKLRGADVARQAVRELLAAVPVCRLDLGTLELALALPFADYEDAVQHACASSERLDAIVTRNIADYKHATLTVLTPVEFLARLPSS